MSNKDLSREPHNIRGTDKIWWFEYSNGIDICVQHHSGVKVHNIPWKVIRNALKRKDKS